MNLLQKLHLKTNTTNTVLYKNFTWKPITSMKA